MTKDDLRRRLEDAGLVHLYPTLESALKPSIGLHLASSDDENIAIGQTKFGGKPDLPEVYAWPTEEQSNEPTESNVNHTLSSKENLKSKPLSFIAQINLTETAGLDETDLLPKSGVLYFFYSADQYAWGFDPEDHDKFVVHYYQGNTSNLTRRDFPPDLPPHAHFRSTSVIFAKQVSVPPLENALYSNVSKADMDALYSMDLADTGNQLLGHAAVIQNEMEMECEMVTSKIWCGDATSYNQQNIATYLPEAKNWQLLLQVDSNDECDMMWGDVGMLYYWIKLEDLRAKRFDKSWLILQCC